jgi:hypothetical protein
MLLTHIMDEEKNATEIQILYFICLNDNNINNH